jgi:hypothetical protein
MGIMTDKEIMLKEKLIKIKENNYLVEEEEKYFSIGLEMMNHIGALDPELRDSLIYVTFFHWITKKRFTYEQLRCLLNISLDNSHLFYKLAEKDEDAVFTRTFSVLIVALIIYVHREEKFLSEKELYAAKEKLVEYMFNEKDVRGYVEEKGWAHSAAHTADALDELAQCHSFDKTDLMDIMNAIRAKVYTGYHVFIDEESERMVTAVESVINRKVFGNAEIIEWLQVFKIEKPETKGVEYYHLKVNVKEFLRSLYFRFLDKEDSQFIIEEVKRLLSGL